MIRYARTITAIAFLSYFTKAADITVNNNPGAVADFASLQSAIDAAQPGDRILLAGSPTSYGTVTINKNDLVFVGVGYLRNENGLPPDASGNNSSATFSPNVGSGSLSINGLTIVGCNISSMSLFGNHSNLLFDRCQIGGFPVVQNEDNCRFTRCHFTGGGPRIHASTNSSLIGCIMGGMVIQDGAVASHCVIASNSNSIAVPGGASMLYIDATSSASNLIINAVPAIFSNSPPKYFGSITHSIGLGDAQLPTGGGNIDNLVTADVVLNTGSNDARWQLAENSPAKNAASDGTDIGAFGGPSPYVLGGVPGAPRISRFLVPALASPTTGLAVEVDIIQDVAP